MLVVTKAYAIGKALHLAVYFIAMLRNSLLAALVMLGWSCSCLSTVVSFMCLKENPEISCTKGSTESGWPFIRF